MLGGGRCQIDTGTFQNDMTTFHNRDDTLTLLIHLGYLAYDMDSQEVFIPNEEVRAEFARAVKASGWEEVIKALTDSDDLLEATLNGQAEIVAGRLDDVHQESASVLAYNNEDSLSCAISLAYYSARKYYYMIRELPAGRGFADIVFFPRKKCLDKPAMIVELKWDHSVEDAIRQIEKKKYVKGLKDYSGELLLVGINYDKKTKIHTCIISKVFYSS